MKRHSPFLFLFASLALCAVPFARGADDGDKKTAVQFYDGPGKEISSDETMTVSFPTAMVAAAEIGTAAKTSPIRFDPPLSVKFIWKSQTEVQLSTEKVPPGTDFKIYLAKGLVDLAGKPVQQEGPLASRSSPAFGIDCDFSEPTVQRRPAVPLRFHPAIKASDLLETAWFQDRDSRKHYPVEVVLDADQEKADSVDSATVTPKADLPGGRTFDLVIEGLKDAATGTAMPGFKVFQLGVTEALHVDKVAAFNYPMQKRRIAVEFSQPVDPAEGRKIKLDPPVPGVETRLVGNSLWLEGNFDITKRYTVVVPAEVKAMDGFAMNAESRWGATFHPKKPAIIFPTDDLHERSRLGLRFAFMQVNTGPLEWKLARIPPEKLLAINSRLREFTTELQDPVTGETEVDEATGFTKWTKTELLIDAAKLEVVTQGSVQASAAEADTLCQVTWKPEKALPAGAYLFEVSGKNAEGKVIGNRALVTFTEFSVAQKQYGDTHLLQVLNVADGHAVPGVRIRAMNGQNLLLADAKTGRDGTATFSEKLLFPSKHQTYPNDDAQTFLLDTPDGPMLQKAESSQFLGSGYPHQQEQDAKDQLRIVVATDRPLYRPGQVVKFKAFVREVAANGELRIPRDRKAEWSVATSGNDDDTLAKGDVALDDYGGLDGEWKIPDTVKVDSYQVTLTMKEGTAQASFDVQEFRPPPFTVAVDDLKLEGAQAGVRISSTYFHGAPNAGAKIKWTADWSDVPNGDDTVVVTDRPRLASATSGRTMQVSGEATLGADGTLEIKHAPPFKDDLPHGWFTVSWNVDVTGPDGQTISQSASTPVYGVNEQLTISGGQVPVEKNAADKKMAITIRADADAPGDKPIGNSPVSVDLYQVITKTAKEEISPSVYHYKNSTIFEKIGSVAGRTPLEKEIPVAEPGAYLLAARNPENPAIPATACRVYAAGPGESQFPVKDEESIGVTYDKQNAGDGKNFYVPGDKAVFSVQSPFPGMAWVTVETDTIIDSFFIPLAGNSGRFELPIKKEYAPNAWVSVYLLKCGGEDQLPSERFGSVQITVQRPDQKLEIKPVFASKEVRPRDHVTGEIDIICEGRPVANADVTVYAVDESILDAGDWHEPPIRDIMYPQRVWGVGTYHGLEELTSGVDTSSLHQKGFIVGGAITAKEAVSAARSLECRTNFPPLAYWKTSLRSDKNGKVPFAFDAPDGLTKYRVIALAQTKEGQFGTGSDCVEVSKLVQIEPALPRFLRNGDEVELRAIVRQKIADELPVTVKCVTGLELVGENTVTQNVKKGLASVVRFRAKVGELTSVPVRFETTAGPGDAVEMTLPVFPPTLLRKESVFAKLGDIQKKIPDDWTKATGSAEFTVSTSPWLPKLTGLPLLLEYPHGCFEQITSRILGYTVLDDLLAYLPEPAGREESYRIRMEAGITRMSENILPGGFLPYWPGGEPNPIPTIAGCWAGEKAAEKGMKIPLNLSSLAQATLEIAKGKVDPFKVDPYSRAFALMVLSEKGDAKTLAPLIREMYSRREGIDDEPRALLALAMHNLRIMPQEQQQLLGEIDKPLEERGFDPDTFSSTTRTEAMRALAFATINPGATGNTITGMQSRIDDFLAASESLSTQENFWLLMAFKALHAPAAGQPVDFKTAAPQPAAISRNGASALWNETDMHNIRDFALRLDRGDALTCLVQAEYRSDSPVTNRNDRGLRIERVVKNLTDKSRTGTEQAPYKLGDKLLIIYRIVSPKQQYLVALEDELPAAFESVQPKINDEEDGDAPDVSLPDEKDAKLLGLDYSELRDRTTCLYFNSVEPGAGYYPVVVRVTSAGVFHWPATQVEPMYDSRFSGLTPSSICHVSGD